MRIKLINELITFLGLFAAMSLFFYWLLNGGAYAKEIRYSLFLNSPFASQDLKQGDILDIKSKLNTGAGENISESDEYILIIPKIAVTAPVIWPRSSATRDILLSLEEGVGIYPGSDLPGEFGRAVLLGHSSRASWYRGNYATIFALLSKLEQRDRFYVIHGNTKYEYEVFAKRFLSPAETNEVLADAPNESEIDLITCYPIGSASQRTFIQGKLVNTNSF